LLAVSDRTNQSRQAAREAIARQRTTATGAGNAVWAPFPNSPQQRAYHCTADVIGYGGAAGGGKTDLALGKAFTQFYKSIIFRREYPQLKDVITRGNNIQDGTCQFVSGEKKHWKTPDGRIVELGAIEHENDKRKYKGRPHDLIVFDEAVDFLESQIRFVMAWLRTDRLDIKPQALLCFNPPTSPEGEWIIAYFAPWLDDTFEPMAAPGEIRWCVTVDDRDVWVDGSQPVDIDGKTYYPQSRTFFKALVEDNPVYMQTGYDRQLESLREPLRSQVRWGDFKAATKDERWQIIPTQWIIEAQNRSLEMAKPDVTLRAVGVDPSRGGNDETAIAKIYGNWFDLITYPGSEVPDGAIAAHYVSQNMEVNAPVWVDVIGIGASVYDHLKVMPGLHVTPVNVGIGSTATDKTGRYKFANLRSQMWWQFYEALDPASGEDIALPPSRELRADLRAPHYRIVGGKIHVESKEDIYKRIHRSPDKADAVILAWHGCRYNHKIEAIFV
jgi:hypothetical protein